MPKPESTKRRKSSKREIADIIADETSDDRIADGRRYWTDDDLRTIRSRGRHDRGYIPSGHRLVGDRLYRTESQPARMTQDDRTLVEALIEMLQLYLRNREAFTAENRAACLALFERLYGFPLGESWRHALALLLREHAQRLEQDRTTGVIVVSDEEGAEKWPPVRTPRAVLDLLREQTSGVTIPKYLTERVIAEAFKMVNLGGGGGRGKKGGRTPEQCVNWIAKQAQSGRERRIPRRRARARKPPA